MATSIPFLRLVTARERCARGVAAAVSLLALLAVVVAAFVRNPAGVLIAVPDDRAADAASLALRSRGAEVYAARACSACHGLRGTGNPALPLDGVADRLGDDALRSWIVGDESVRGAMPARVVAAKRRYADLSDDDLRALVAFLRHAP